MNITRHNARKITTNQTIGPFFHEGLKWAFSENLGQVCVCGHVFDGNGVPVTDAMLEAWLPNAALGETGFVRIATDAAGRYEFCVPAGAASDDGRRAGHRDVEHGRAALDAAVRLHWCVEGSARGAGAFTRGAARLFAAG